MGNPSRVNLNPRTSQALTLRLGIPQSGTHSLSDQAPHKLGCTQYGEDHLAGWDHMIESGKDLLVSQVSYCSA
jgi:hypothetical protein